MTTENTETTLTPGSPEYNAEMARRYDERRAGGKQETAETAEIPKLPEGGSEKFYDAKTGAYDWQSHAKELEFKLTQKGGKEEKPAEGTAEEKPKDGASDDDVQDVITKAGLTADSLREQIIETGTVSDDAKAALVTAGVPEWLIDEHVALAKAHLDTQTSSAMEYVGGEDAWGDLNTWASTNLNDAEKTSFNEMLRGDAWKLAIDTLRVRAGAAVQKNEPNLRRGTTTGGSTTGYTSRAQMIAAMRDPRYRTDPAYRRQVAESVGVSDFRDDYRG